MYTSAPETMQGLREMTQEAGDALKAACIRTQAVDVNSEV